MENISHLNIITIIISFFVASISINFAIIKIGMSMVSKNMEIFQKEINTKIQDTFSVFGNDFSRIGSKIMIVDESGRENTENIIRQEG